MKKKLTLEAAVEHSILSLKRYFFFSVAQLIHNVKIGYRSTRQERKSFQLKGQPTSVLPLIPQKA